MLASAPEDPHPQTEHDADDDAGDDGKKKGVLWPLDSNVARQTPEPLGSEAAPQNKAEHEHNRADDNQEFSDVVHVFRRLREPSAGTRLRFDGSTIQGLL